MKKIWGVLVLVLLTGCLASDGYSSYKLKYQNSARYFAKVKSPSTGMLGWAGSNVSYDDAINIAKSYCTNRGTYDCIPHTIGNRLVYRAPTREDAMITKAKNLCRKIGVSPGTTQFTDCTIKLLSTTSSGQQTIIVGQRRRSIYPLHCRQMGGASNW